jgi:hypothetical protein
MTGRYDVVWLVLAVLAVVAGVWLGLGGADVSPIFTEAPLPGTAGPGR